MLEKVSKSVIIIPMRTLKLDNKSHGNHNGFSLSSNARTALIKLGHDLELARRRRRLTQESLAERMGASLSTVRRMESGDPRVPIHFFARAFMIFGELDALANVLDATKDNLGLSLEDANLPRRIRARPMNRAL